MSGKGAERSDDGPGYVGMVGSINPFADLSLRQAARVVGIGFIASFILAIIVGNFLLPNFINPGDTDELAGDIDENERAFNMAVGLYLVILTLDAAIALGLYVVLKPANRTLASLSRDLRLLYVVIMLIGLFALTFHLIDVYDYGTIKLLGYLFFTAHILVTGFTVFISGYISMVIGILMMIAFISYILAFYLSSLVPEGILVIFMLFMIIAELSLSVWLLIKSAKLEQIVDENRNASKSISSLTVHLDRVPLQKV